MFKAGILVAVVLGVGWFAWLRLSDSTTKQAFVFRRIDSFSLSLEVYRPRDWSERDQRPCVVWFFGGGWEVGVPRQYSRHAAALARIGVVSVTPDYRVRSRHGRETTPFDSLEDARAAMDWVRSHADELGIDPHRIAAAGGSSGGHLALSCAALKGAGVDCVPNALILFNPVSDFEIPYVERMTNKLDRVRLREISPLHQMQEPLPPTIIFHGTSDAIVPFRTSEALVTRAKELGSQSITLIPYRGRGHEFHLAGAASRREFKKSLSEIEEFLRSLGWLDF